MIVKKVHIPARLEHEGLFAVDVNLNWVCPVCGQPRGEVNATISYDGSKRMTVDGWVNVCGHVDKYMDVVKEAVTNGLNLDMRKGTPGGVGGM